MQAKIIANKLKAMKVSIQNIQEGTDLEDGMIVINTSVHVQVSTYGNEFNIVKECGDGSFEFYPSRVSIPELLKDLKEATA